MLEARVYRLIFVFGEVRRWTEIVKKMTLRSMPTNDLSNAILSKKNIIKITIMLRQSLFQSKRPLWRKEMENWNWILNRVAWSWRLLRREHFSLARVETCRCQRSTCMVDSSTGVLSRMPSSYWSYYSQTILCVVVIKMAAVLCVFQSVSEKDLDEILTTQTNFT